MPSCATALARYGLEHKVHLHRRRLAHGRSAVRRRSRCSSSTATTPTRARGRTSTAGAAFVRPGGHLLLHDAVDTGGYGNVYPGVARAVGEIDAEPGWERQAGRRLDRALRPLAVKLCRGRPQLERRRGHARRAALARRSRDDLRRQRLDRRLRRRGRGAASRRRAAPHRREPRLRRRQQRRHPARARARRRLGAAAEQRRDRRAGPRRRACARAAQARPDAGLLACKILHEDGVRCSTPARRSTRGSATRGASSTTGRPATCATSIAPTALLSPSRGPPPSVPGCSTRPSSVRRGRRVVAADPARGLRRRVRPAGARAPQGLRGDRRPRVDDESLLRHAQHDRRRRALRAAAARGARSAAPVIVGAHLVQALRHPARRRRSAGGRSPAGATPAPGRLGQRSSP